MTLCGRRRVIDGFEVTLSVDAIAALCDRLGLPAPVPLGSREALLVGGPVPNEGFDVAGGMASEDVLAPVDEAGDGADADELAVALGVLGAPEILISALRQGATPGMTTSICVSGEQSAELRPVGAGGFLVALFPVGSALGRVTAFCQLEDRPAPHVAPFRTTAARLAAASERVAAGDVPGAAAVLGGGEGTEAARAAFLRALASPRTACQVAVVDRRRDGRLHGTVTAWLDGGPAGLWRVPPTGSARVDAELEIGPVAAADIVAEITEGFPELVPG